MPQPGYKQTMTEDALRQRKQAARTHGAYAIKDKGRAAMTADQRSVYIELQEKLSDRNGVIDVLREQAANSIIVCRVASDYVAKQAKKGVPLDEIALLRSLPAFQNSAARMLVQLLSALPGNRNILDIGEEIAKAVEEHESDS